jgi:hypothetical protein
MLKRLGNALFAGVMASNRAQHDVQLLSLWATLKGESRNPLNKAGAKFSQFDEDGITLEILRRIGLNTGTFAELGVGNGAENNTLILLATGFQGFWVGGEDLFFNHELAPGRFCFLKRWIDRDNVGAKIEYDKAHRWERDDYFGASLASFNELFSGFGYTLVCCNCSGVNAFFIRNDLLQHFADVPRDIGELYSKPRYYLFQSYGHRPSAKTIERILREAISG